MHRTIKDALLAKVEDPAAAGLTLTPLLAALRTQGDAAVCEAIERATLLSAGARTAVAPPRPGGAPGTLGAAVASAPAAEIGASAGFAPTASADAVRLAATLREQWETWRAVLGYGRTALDALALHAFTAAQCASGESLGWIAIHALRVGFIVPEATIPVYERLADGWLRGKASAPFLAADWAAQWSRPLAEVRGALGVPPSAVDAATEAAALPLVARPGRLPDGLAALLWRVVGQQVDPAAITATIAAFGATYSSGLRAACARAIQLHPGQAAVARQPWPPRVDIHALAVYPPDTLGHAYYHLIVDNGFDPEVLDPDTVTGFHPDLDGTNRRILQQHELWHLVAGYSTSPLHESAISAFQLAQFGHNYSAAFLATMITTLLFSTPVFLDPFLQVTAEAWRHGRATPPMMAIDWPAQWGKSLDAIRAEFGVAPFVSVVPDVMA